MGNLLDAILDVKKLKGYSPPTRGQNISLKIRDLMSKRSKKTIQSLNKIAKIIIDNVPQDDRMSYYKFLHGIKDCNDDIVRYCIESYYNTKAFQNNKGFAYLRVIIQNQFKNNDKILENERRRLGSVPPIID
jgi:hypothetical protein